MMSTGAIHELLEVGVISPEPVPGKGLGVGEVGYLITGVKDVRQSRVGDTITSERKGATEALGGYRDPKPMVFSGLYPIDGSDYPDLRDALDKLKLNDAALVYEPETSLALGFGFRCGFLGLLHLEIVRERLERESGLDLISTAPNVVYRVFWTTTASEIVVTNPSEFPTQKVAAIFEPVVRSTIILPSEFVGTVMELCQQRRGTLLGMDYLSEDRVEMRYTLPLAEIVFDFFDQLKSRTRGYASLDYELTGEQEADLVKVDILLHGDPVDAFSAIVHRDKAMAYGAMMTAKLKELIPRQQFEVPIQAAIGSRVITRETIRAIRKDVLAKCYGGDITRKRKLLEKQKEGKKRMKMVGRVEVPQEAFIAALSTSDAPSAKKIAVAVDRDGSAVRRVRPRAVLREPLRVLRLQHVHGDRARRRPSAATPSTRCCAAEMRLAAAARRPARARPTRSSSAAAPRRCSEQPAWRHRSTRCARSFGLAPGAEVTTEANPDTVDERHAGGPARRRATPASRSACRARSAHVLRMLDRTHTPGASVAAARAATRVGFEHVNLDLIYGTPGETDDDLRRSVDDALGSRRRPRVGVRADRRGRHSAGPRDRARRAAHARRRRPRRPVRDRRRDCSRRRA